MAKKNTRIPKLFFYSAYYTSQVSKQKKMFDSWIVGVNVWKLLDRDWLFSKIVIKMDSLKK